MFRKASVLLGLIPAFSGCRLGNQTIYPEVNQKRSLGPINGYYVANPTTLTLYATTTQTQMKSAPITQIPEMISKTITNPVGIAIQNGLTGEAVFFSPSTNLAFPIDIQPNMRLTYARDTTQKTFWKDPDCQKYLQIYQDGQVLINPSVSPPPGTTLSLAGSIQLSIQIIHTFEGNCAPTFQSLYLCYQNSTQCGGSDPVTNTHLQAKVIQTFAPWIQSQTIEVSDIPHLTNFAFEVSYQP
jgi:hypothetical protein